jgi:hypothetical protein
VVHSAVGINAYVRLHVKIPVFHLLGEAQILIKRYRRDRNTVSPHGSQGCRLTAPEAFSSNGPAADDARAIAPDLLVGAVQWQPEPDAYRPTQKCHNGAGRLCFDNTNLNILTLFRPILS